MLKNRMIINNLHFVVWIEVGWEVGVLQSTPVAKFAIGNAPIFYATKLPLIEDIQTIEAITPFVFTACIIETNIEAMKIEEPNGDDLILSINRK